MAWRFRAARALLLTCVGLGLAWPASGHQQGSSTLDEQVALAASQAAIGQPLGRHDLVDSDGQPVSLDRYRGRPLVISLIYTSCSETCPLVTQALYRAVKTGREALGAASFAVVTVGFDAMADTPERMRAYAAGQGVDLPDWAFLSGDHAAIDRLTTALGFLYATSPKGFDHVTQTTIVDAGGTIYTHIYGAEFDPPTLVEPLKDLVFGRHGAIANWSGLVDRVRLICTVYDERTGRYIFDYSIFVGLAIGAASLAGIAVVLVRGWLRTRAPRPSG
jgi:protein SCO1/2